MHPAALAAGLRIHLRQRRPEAQHTVANSQLRGPREAALLHAQQDFPPALRGLPHTVLNGQEVLVAAGVYADHHQHAQPFARAPQAAVDAVRPDVYPVVGKAVPAPRPVLLVPTALESAHHVRRQPASRFLAHQRRHRRAHLTRRHPVQVQSRNRRVETRTAANVRRHQGRAKRHRRTRAAAQLRNFDLHCGDPRQDVPARKVTVANQPLPSAR